MPIATSTKVALRKIESAINRAVRKKQQLDKSFIVTMDASEHPAELCQRLHEHFLKARDLHRQLGTQLDAVCSALDELAVAVKNRSLH